MEIKYDPSYDEGLLYESEECDAEGTTTRGLLTVGREFPRAPTLKSLYPFGNPLKKRKRIAVYTVAHEEVGQKRMSTGVVSLGKIGGITTLDKRPYLILNTQGTKP